MILREKQVAQRHVVIGRLINRMRKLFTMLITVGVYRQQGVS